MCPRRRRRSRASQGRFIASKRIETTLLGAPSASSLECDAREQQAVPTCRLTATISGSEYHHVSIPAQIIPARRPDSGDRAWYRRPRRGLRPNRSGRPRGGLSPHRHGAKIRQRTRGRRSHPGCARAAERHIPHHQSIARASPCRRFRALDASEPAGAGPRPCRSLARALAGARYAAAGDHGGARADEAPRPHTSYRGGEFQHRAPGRGDQPLSGAAGRPAGRISPLPRPIEGLGGLPPARIGVHCLLSARARPLDRRSGDRRDRPPQGLHRRASRVALARSTGRRRGHSAILAPRARRGEYRHIRLCAHRRRDEAHCGARAPDGRVVNPVGRVSAWDV